MPPPAAASDAEPPAPAVDLIIPARNEEPNLVALLTALPRWALRQVVVVDNGSTDRTATLAQAHGAIVVHEPKQGYGRACLAGLNWLANCPQGPPRAVAFLDADLADEPAQLPRLCQPILADQADLALGARTALAQPDALSLPQRWGNTLACRLMKLATGHHYRDLAPMRVIRWSSLARLDMQDRTWGWTLEMQFKAAQMGLRVVELDVPYRPRHAGRSKISGSLLGSLRAGSRILATTARLWWTCRGQSKR